MIDICLGFSEQQMIRGYLSNLFQSNIIPFEKQGPSKLLHSSCARHNIWADVWTPSPSIQAKLSFDPDPDNVLLLHSIAAEVGTVDHQGGLKSD